MQQKHQGETEHHQFPTSLPDPYTVQLTAGPELPGHICEHNDADHLLRIDGDSPIQFTKGEYKLFLLILEHAHDECLSYTDIAHTIYHCELDEELLSSLRKRVSSIRRKIADYGIDIINVPHRGYKISTFSTLVIPYRRGYRARKARSRHK